MRNTSIFAVKSSITVHVNYIQKEIYWSTQLPCSSKSSSCFCRCLTFCFSLLQDKQVSSSSERSSSLVCTIVVLLGHLLPTVGLAATFLICGRVSAKPGGLIRLRCNDCKVSCGLAAVFLICCRVPVEFGGVTKLGWIDCSVSCSWVMVISGRGTAFCSSVIVLWSCVVLFFVNTSVMFFLHAPVLMGVLCSSPLLEVIGDGVSLRISMQSPTTFVKHKSKCFQIYI